MDDELLLVFDWVGLGVWVCECGGFDVWVGDWGVLVLGG